ncbi:MAG: hypothetical protein QN720_12455 [Nitrososphaeraceae archaeon]|nr:hypothetical protein [Nitrososphaeraceae archaeon]MDW0313880.1 hypothetical protein [Nitrososphaeraceae archaeon]MDW0333754.1 hypothetical protein [Nitrososphaeraceae archaeon]
MLIETVVTCGKAVLLMMKVTFVEIWAMMTNVEGSEEEDIGAAVTDDSSNSDD